MARTTDYSTKKTKTTKTWVNDTCPHCGQPIPETCQTTTGHYPGCPVCRMVRSLRPAQWDRMPWTARQRWTRRAVEQVRHHLAHHDLDGLAGLVQGRAS